MLTTAALSAVDVELLVVPWFEEEGLEAFAELDRACGGEVARALGSREFGGRLFDVFFAPVTDGRWKARRIALVGSGALVAFGTETARRVATVASLTARQKFIERMGFVLRPGRADASGEVDITGFAQAVAEGLALAEFNAATHKTSEPPPAPAPQSTIVLPVSFASPGLLPRIELAVTRGRLLGECTNLARGLDNEPGNTLTPREFELLEAIGVYEGWRFAGPALLTANAPQTFRVALWNLGAFDSHNKDSAEKALLGRPALATINLMEKLQLGQRANAIGARVTARFRELQQRFPQWVGDVRGLGAMIAIELVHDADPHSPATELTAEVLKGTVERGLLILSAGTYGNVIRFLSPLVISDSQLDAGLDILCDEVTKAIVRRL